MYGLYVHIPFCVKKCKYCDFVSFRGRDGYKDRYIDCLVDEIKQYKGAEVDSIFIGGGTPTVLSANLFKRMFSAIWETFNVKADAEITCEMNPGTADGKKLAAMRECGVNRLSIGVQSFDDGELAKIGRIHTAAMAEEAVRTARACGFENISIDLMSALPFQSKESFKKTLEKAVGVSPEHISCYSLILEEGTPLFEEYENGLISLPDEDTERDMYELACDYLEKCGYKQYEISNFAKSGRQSRHNIKYWQCREYIGAGLASHSYIDGVRSFNTSDLAAYLSGKYKADGGEPLSRGDKIEEFMIMGLRMTEGISRREFKSRFAVEADELFGKEIKKLTAGGFLEDDGKYIRLTRPGISVSNSVMCEFAVCNIKKDI